MDWACRKLPVLLEWAGVVRGNRSLCRTTLDQKCQRSRIKVEMGKPTVIRSLRQIRPWFRTEDC